MVMRESSTIDKFCLSTLNVPRLLIFREMFIRLVQLPGRAFAHTLYGWQSADHNQDQNEVRAHMGCIFPFGGVLQTTYHLLSNQEVNSVLTCSVPRTRQETHKWLEQSVWDAASYSQFKNNRLYIQTYADHYLQAWTNFRFTSRGMGTIVVCWNTSSTGHRTSIFQIESVRGTVTLRNRREWKLFTPSWITKSELCRDCEIIRSFWKTPYSFLDGYEEYVLTPPIDLELRP